VPALLHVCRQSRDVAQRIYINIGQGGLPDPERDKLLVPADRLPTYFWCKRHHQNVIGETPQFGWSRHIVYYAPTLCYPSWDRPPVQYGRELQYMFRPRAGGRFVETITVLTDERVKEEIWASLVQGWTELFGNETTDEEYSLEPELIRMDDAALAAKSRAALARGSKGVVEGR
jgi:hypothetical protein